MGQRPARMITLTVLLLGVPGIALPQTPTSLTLNPATITGGQISTGQVSLSGPAPAGGLVVQVSSNKEVAFQFGGPVTVPAGATTANFTVATLLVAESWPVTISAVAGGVTRTAQLTVLPPVPSSVTLEPSTIVGGEGHVSSGTVSLSGTAPQGFVVQFFSSNPAVAQILSDIQFEVRGTTGHFYVTTYPVALPTAVTITASAGGGLKTTVLHVVPLGLSSLVLAPTEVLGGQSSTGQVSLSSPALSGGFFVQLSSGNTVAATVPASVTVPAGATTASFTVTTSPDAYSPSAIISATAGGITKTRALTVRYPVLTSVTLAPSTIVAPGAVTGQVSLTIPALSGGRVVALSSSNTAVATVPASVTVAAGATTGSFAITTVPVAQSTAVTISAITPKAGSVSAVTKTAVLDVVPPVLVRIRLPGVTGGNPSAAQVSLNGPALPGGFAVQLSSSNTAVATVPASVTVAAGATTASLKVATVPVAQSTTVTITATASGVSKTGTLNVLPPVPSSVTLAPTTIAGGTGVTGQVGLSGPAPSGGLAVNLSSSNPAVATVPTSVTVEAGATTAKFKVATVKVVQSTAVTITATAGGVTKTAQLTVTP